MAGEPRFRTKIMGRFYELYKYKIIGYSYVVDMKESSQIQRTVIYLITFEFGEIFSIIDCL